MRRRVVEDKLRAESIRYTQSCCRTTTYKYTDQIDIGREPGNWVCAYWLEEVEIEFDGPSDSSPKDPDDTLKNIHLQQRSGPCL